jgi:hypothetical protein
MWTQLCSLQCACVRRLACPFSNMCRLWAVNKHKNMCMYVSNLAPHGKCSNVYITFAGYNRSMVDMIKISASFVFLMHMPHPLPCTQFYVTLPQYTSTRLTVNRPTSPSPHSTTEAKLMSEQAGSLWNNVCTLLYNDMYVWALLAALTCAGLKYMYMLSGQWASSSHVESPTLCSPFLRRLRRWWRLVHQSLLLEREFLSDCGPYVWTYMDGPV